MKRQNRRPRWQFGLRRPLIAAIKAQIANLESNRAYEARPYTVKSTTAALKKVAETSAQLAAQLDELSPTARAAIAEFSFRDGLIGREELDEMMGLLARLARAAEKAADFFPNAHSPYSQGQGSGSAMGRDSDLRALTANFEWDTGVPSELIRSPAHKFGYEVLRALFTHGKRAEHTAASLVRFLDLVWADVGEGERVSWKALVAKRAEIAASVAHDKVNDALWAAVRAQSPRSSAKSKSPVPP